MLCVYYNLSPSHELPKDRVSCWSGGRSSAGWLHLVWTTMCFIGPQVSRVSWVSSVHWDWQDWSLPLGISPSPQNTLEFWRYSPILPSFPRKKQGVSFQSYATILEEKDYGKMVSWIFLPASVWLSLCSSRVQESLNWFLDFSQRKLVCGLLLNPCVLGGKEVPRFPILPSCWCPNQSWYPDW